MTTLKTDQGDFEVCNCGNPLGHAGAVWHPPYKDHPSGAKLLDQEPDSPAAELASTLTVALQLEEV